MNPYTLEDILAGWRQAETSSIIGPLFGGHPVPEADILVDDGACMTPPEGREVLGEMRLAWVAPESLRPGPYGRMAVATSKQRFSGANRHRRGTMRSVALFYRMKDDPVKLESAAALAAVVAARNVREDIKERSADVVGEMLEILGFHCLQEIWARSNSAPMPIRPPSALGNIDTADGDGRALGKALRLWHDLAFRKLVAVAATPVRFGLGTLTLNNFEEVTERYARGLNGGHGEVSWKTMTRGMLERMVWEEPRTQLMTRLGVSDVAITKRCKKQNITIPPRGYWQRKEAGVDPRPLLDKAGIFPPGDVLAELARKFDLADCA